MLVKNKETTFYVYLHTTPNGKYYIGITSFKPEMRWKKDGKGYKNHPYFWNAIQKWGWDNIKHEILYEGLTEEEAIQKEIELIQEYKSNDKRFGYNMTAGGEGTKGHITSEETKEKLRQTRLGKKASEETKAKMSRIRKGKKLNLSEEQRKKRGDRIRKVTKERIERFKEDSELWEEFCKSQARPGEKNGMWGKHHTEETKEKFRNRKMSEETKEKMSVAKKGKGLYGDNNNAKRVVKLDSDKHFLCVYNSLREASEKNHINYDYLREIIKERKKKNNCYWLKEEDYLKEYKKTFYICSDIHSFYRPFKKALEDAGFKYEDKNAVLVICGDLFDRGPDSVDLYKFIKSLPEERCILIRGNHEDLFLELLEKRRIDNHDISNGTVKTLYSIAGKETLYDELMYGNSWWTFGMNRSLVEDIIDMREKSFKNILNYKKIKEFKDFLNSDRWLDYYETKNYIFTHSFIPLKAKDEGLASIFGYGSTDPSYLEYDPDWRKQNRSGWELRSARWGNPWKCAYYGLNKTGKYIVCGHWHTSDFYNNDLREQLIYEEITEEEFQERQLSSDNNPIYANSKLKLIGLDTCTALSYRVNVLVLNESEL